VKYVVELNISKYNQNVTNIKYVILSWNDVKTIWPNQTDKTGPTQRLFKTTSKITGVDNTRKGQKS